MGSRAERPKGNPYAEVSIQRAQIVPILKEHDAGATFVELGRRHGAHPTTVAAWKSKYGSMEASKLARARELEDENGRTKRIIANLTLENDAMKA